jgi:hypothetical protein
VNSWIFQANPDRYDLLGAAALRRPERWSMKVRRRDVAVGDTVWFLVGGPEAGIYIRGTITSLPYEIAEDDGFGKWKVDVSFDAYVEPPLLRTELLARPDLQDFHPLRGIVGTNFLIPESVATSLELLARGRLRPIGGVEPAASDATGIAPDLSGAAIHAPSPRRVWVVRAQGGVHAEEFRALGLIAIGFGVPQSLAGRTWNEVWTLKRMLDPEGSPGSVGQAAGAIYRIASEFNVGDFILSPEPGTSLLVGEIVSQYEFLNPAPIEDWHHSRRVRWFGRVDRNRLSDAVRHSIGSLLTLFLPAHQPDLLELIERLKDGQVPAPITTATAKEEHLPDVMNDPPSPSGSEPQTDKQPLTFLLDKIHNRELGLPDFQRSFVWDPAATQELIASIARGFPVGNLLFLRGSSEVFLPRAVEGAPVLHGNQAALLVLDGQQRLTSLYQAFAGVGLHRFFLDIRALMNGEEIDSAIKAYTVSRSSQWSTTSGQARSLMFPLARLRDFGDWKDEVLDFWDARDHERLQQLRKYLNRVDKVLIEPVSSYLFPITTLSERTPTEAVCTIFETLNRTGIKLTVFELITARAFAEGHRLRELWDLAKERYPVLEDFEIEPYYILQTVALRNGLIPQRGVVVGLPVKTLVEHWEASVRGMADGLTMLRDECGVLTAKWLPYGPMLPTLAAAWHDVEEAHGPQIGARRLKLQQWFWCASFAGVYENASNSRAAADVPLLHKWLTGGDVHAVVKEFSFDPKSWFDVTVRQRGLYRSTMALILSSRPRDFHQVVPLTAKVIAATGADDHHIFPSKYLAERGLNTHLDTILNHTLIDKHTNTIIGKKAPSVYLNDIRADLGNATDQVLLSHGLPIKPDEPLFRDDYEAFLGWRMTHLANELTRVTRGPQPESTERLAQTSELLLRGESDSLEFKSSARFNFHTKARDERLEKRIVASVAGFLNGQGGTLLIGVDDNGGLVGLEGDYSLMAKPDSDRFQLWLTDLLAGYLGKSSLTRVKTTFERIDEKDVCRLNVERSSVPVFARPPGSTSDEFYVRFGNSTRQLSMEEYEEYRRNRFG